MALPAAGVFLYRLIYRKYSISRRKLQSIVGKSYNKFKKKHGPVSGQNGFWKTDIGVAGDGCGCGWNCRRIAAWNGTRIAYFGKAERILPLLALPACSTRIGEAGNPCTVGKTKKYETSYRHLVFWRAL